MSTWRLYFFGLEVFRAEHTADADKTLGEAMAELMESDEPEYGEVVDNSWVDVGREAGNDEHIVYAPEPMVFDDDE